MSFDGTHTNLANEHAPLIFKKYSPHSLKFIFIREPVSRTISQMRQQIRNLKKPPPPLEDIDVIVMYALTIISSILPQNVIPLTDAEHNQTYLHAFRECVKGLFGNLYSD